MSVSAQRYRQIWDGVSPLREKSNDVVHFNLFAKAADDMLHSYSSLVKQGLPAGSVALAMLGATVNLYEIFGQRAELPLLLRSIAEIIESEVELN